MGSETPEERKARWRSVAIGGARADVKTKTDPNKIRPMQQPQWEKGIARDHRGVPYVKAEDASPITVKQFADHRGTYEKQINDLRRAPHAP